MTIKKIYLLVFLFLVGFSCNVINRQNKHDATNGLNVTVKFNRDKENDTLELIIVNPFFNTRRIDSIHSILAVKGEDEYYSFHLPSKYNGYFQIMLVNNRNNYFQKDQSPQPLTPQYFYEAGDSLSIEIMPQYLKGIDTILFHFHRWYKYIITGRGSEKIRLTEDMDSIKRIVGDSYKENIFNKEYKFINPNGQSTDSAYFYLKKNRDKISPTAYWVLQADNVYSNGRGKFGNIQYYLQEILGVERTGYLYELPNNGQTLDKFRAHYERSMDTAFNHYNIPDKALLQSREYLKYNFHKAQIESLIYCGQRNPDSIFNRIVSKYSGQFREKLLTYFLVNFVFMGDNFNQNIVDALRIVKQPYYKNALKKIRTREFGKSAYNFSLVNKNGDYVSLSDFKDKILFIDFWYAGCGACAEFYKSCLSYAEQKFRNDSLVKFISICIDKKERWRKALETGLYTSKDAINLCIDGKGYNSPVLKYYGIVIYPSFLIVQNGKIKCFNSPELRRSYKELIKYLYSLKNDNNGV